MDGIWHFITRPDVLAVEGAVGFLIAVGGVVTAILGRIKRGGDGKLPKPDVQRRRYQLFRDVSNDVQSVGLRLTRDIANFRGRSYCTFKPDSQPNARYEYRVGFDVNNRARVEMYLANNRPLFHRLDQHRADIAGQTDLPLQWNGQIGRTAASIGVYRPERTDGSDQSWKDTAKWTTVHLLALYRGLDSQLDN